MPKQILVTGAAGFIASHVVEQLLSQGHQVLGVDNFLTGNRANLTIALAHHNFEFLEADVSQPVAHYLPEHRQFEEIYHLASPASPRGYQDNPIATYLVNGFGTHYLCEYAAKTKATILYSSTSEVYGDPLVHPQPESYWGNVSIRGVRACYDESKRFGEMVQTVWAREHQVTTKTVRIFNTYGPRMDPRDGRVFPNFISQALTNKPITVYGDGTQTRSFCFVSDLVNGIIATMQANETKGDVVNLGNPEEHSMLEMAELIKELTGSNSDIVFEPLPQDDPTRRQPDISKAKALLSWEPTVSLKDGLTQTIEYFKTKLGV